MPTAHRNVCGCEFRSFRQASLKEIERLAALIHRVARGRWLLERSGPGKQKLSPNRHFWHRIEGLCVKFRSVGMAQGLLDDTAVLACRIAVAAIALGSLEA